MLRDLRLILDGWEYEPGKISARRIIGSDGQEKIQTRVDLGLLQFFKEGRPDGESPHGAESLLAHHEARLRNYVEREAGNTGFELTPVECRELQREGYLYYQRYLSLFVLEDYEGVARDTARNLRMLDLVQRYAGRREDRVTARGHRPYVLMMYTRAKARRAMQQRDLRRALRTVRKGMRGVAAALRRRDRKVPPGDAMELKLLRALEHEILDALPADAPERLKLALREALAAEDYERATDIRNRLRGASGADQPT